MALGARESKTVELEAIQHRLWTLMREEAMAADRELADV